MDTQEAIEAIKHALADTTYRKERFEKRVEDNDFHYAMRNYGHEAQVEAERNHHLSRVRNDVRMALYEYRETGSLTDDAVAELRKALRKRTEMITNEMSSQMTSQAEREGQGEAIKRIREALEITEEYLA